MIRFHLHYSLAKCIFTNHTSRVASVTFDVFPIHTFCDLSPFAYYVWASFKRSVQTLGSLCVFIHVISSSLTPHSPSCSVLISVISSNTEQSAVNAGRHSLPPLYFFQLRYSLFMKGWVREGKDVWLIAHWVRGVWDIKVQRHMAWVTNDK